VFSREIENSSGTDLLTTCRELGVAVVAAMPLGRGLLTSTFAAGELAGVQDMRTKAMPRFTEDNQNANVKLVTKFKAFADKKGCTVAQLAIAVSGAYFSSPQLSLSSFCLVVPKGNSDCD